MKEKGVAIAKDRLDKLQETLANISGFLFDRTNGVLQNDKQITIEKYDQILADHVRHIIESNEEIRKLLDKIDYLNYEEESGATEVKEV